MFIQASMWTKCDAIFISIDQTIERKEIMMMMMRHARIRTSDAWTRLPQIVCMCVWRTAFSKINSFIYLFMYLFTMDGEIHRLKDRYIDI